MKKHTVKSGRFSVVSFVSFFLLLLAVGLLFFRQFKLPKEAKAVAGTLNITAPTGTVSTQNFTLGGAAVTATGAELNTLVGIGTTAVTTQLGLKAPLASPTFTGNVTMSGHLGLAGYTPSASYSLYSDETYTNATTVGGIANLARVYTTGANGTHSGVGITNYGIAYPAAGLSNTGTMYGDLSYAGNWDVGTLTTAVGLYGYADNNTTGIITNAFGVKGYVYNASTGTITNAYALYAGMSGGTITNGYGVYIADSNATTDWGIYQVGATDTNYFAGNVGIGTTSPGARLDLGANAVTNQFYVYNNGTTNTYGLGATVANGLEVYTSTSLNKMAFGTYNQTTFTPQMVINNGNVGIGTTAPTELLSLSSAGSANIKIAADTDNVTETDVAQILLSQDGGVSTGVFSLDPSSTVNNLIIGVNSTTAPNIYFGTASSGTTYVSSANAKMTILNNGNVGIGTTAPATKLDVAGTIRATSSNTAYYSYLQANYAEYNAFELGISGHKLITTNGGYSAGSSLQLWTSDSAKMTIDTGGNVGIGTTAPIAKLHIAGASGESFATAVVEAGGTNLTATQMGMSSYSYGGLVVGDGEAGTYPSLSIGGTNRTAAGNIIGKFGFNSFNTNNNMLTTSGTEIRALSEDATSTNYGMHLAFLTRTGTSALAEAMRITATGNVGIGTAAPASKLSVGGVGYNTATIYGVNSGGNSTYGVYGEGTGANNTGVYGKGTNSGVIGEGATGVVATGTNTGVAADGGAGVGVYAVGATYNFQGYGKSYFNSVGLGRDAITNALEINGTASKTAAGSFIANSDRRIKTDIQDIPNALATIELLHPVQFKYTDGYRTTRRGVGNFPYYNFIAQEFQQVFPNFVQDSGETVGADSHILQIDTYAVTPYLVKAMQEQQTQIASLSTALAGLSLTSAGDLVIKGSTPETFAVQNSKDNSVITRIAAFAELVVAKIQVGVLEAKKLVVDGIDVAKKLTELSQKVESQQAQIDDLKKTVEGLKK